jgi:hypothetical protein
MDTRYLRDISSIALSTDVDNVIAFPGVEQAGEPVRHTHRAAHSRTAPPRRVGGGCSARPAAGGYWAAAMSSRFALHRADGTLHLLELGGRCEDTLAKLIDAGPEGMTSLENPAPRLSDYVFKLRKRGITIDTITETHGGDFPGVRYVLRSKVERLAPMEMAA